MKKTRFTETPNPNFTFCEVRIISLIKQGLSNKEIANELSIEVTTVKTHRKNILKKIGLQGKTAFMQFVFSFTAPYQNFTDKNNKC